MDGRPNRRNKAAFSNFSCIVWTESNSPKCTKTVGKELHFKFNLTMKIMGRSIFKGTFRCPHDTIIRSKYNI